jgi:drug/metabolite transporter (DMT)-like permease
MEEITPGQGNIQESRPARPLILTVLCLFSFIFFGLIALIFLMAMLYTGSIAGMVLQYMPENSLTRAGVFFFTFGGFLLHVLSFSGTILLWKMKRKGYILFGISTVLIAGYQLFSATISPLTTAVYVFLIFAFGFFLKKMR